MIPLPPGWRYQPAIDMFTLIAPDGPDAGIIRYKERIRPLVPLGRLVKMQLEACPDFVLESVAGSERLTTREGEHAALVQLVGREGGRPAGRTIGVTFGDDFFAMASALVLDPARAAGVTALVRELVLADNIGLGVRRRRFEHAPPPGWQPLPMTLATEWLPPGFPSDQAAITVYPANVRQLGGAKIFEHELGATLALGFVATSRPEPVPCAGQGGLKGHLYTAVLAHADGWRVQEAMAILEDDRYVYPVKLSQRGDDLDRHRDVLGALVASIRPIPPGAVEPSWLPQTPNWTN